MSCATDFIDLIGAFSMIAGALTLAEKGYTMMRGPGPMKGPDVMAAMQMAKKAMKK